MKRRILSLLLCTAMALSLFACTIQEPEESPSPEVQSDTPSPDATDEPSVEPDVPSSVAPDETSTMTTGQKNALSSAKNYLSFTAFSCCG